jgi:hypothetical protein
LLGIETPTFSQGTVLPQHSFPGPIIEPKHDWG